MEPQTDPIMEETDDTKLKQTGQEKGTREIATQMEKRTLTETATTRTETTTRDLHETMRPADQATNSNNGRGGTCRTTSKWFGQRQQ